MFKPTVSGRPSRLVKKFLIFGVLLVVLGIGGLFYIQHRETKSADKVCDEFLQSSPGPLEEAPAVCLPGFNTPHATITGPDQIDLGAGKSKSVTINVTNNRDITRVYGFTVTAHGVRVSGLPQDVTIDSGEIKPVNFTVSATAQDKSANFFQIEVSPVGGDTSDSGTINTEVTIR